MNSNTVTILRKPAAKKEVIITADMRLVFPANFQAAEIVYEGNRKKYKIIEGSKGIQMTAT